ncbi:MAG: DUF4010 domain-containing protein [Alphaproteobacteria bacterium]|nr:DUF4010 domain-containing protein [Alphaproteobacteria bacterium]
MNDLDLYLRLAVALGVGIGVGIERGWKQRDEVEGERQAGLRTFALLALAGAAGGLSVSIAGVWFLAALALGISALIVTLYVTSQRGEHHDHGATTETAALLTFVAGALAGLGAMLAAGIIGAIMIALLDFKPQLHALLRRIQDFEMTAGVKLLLVAAVLLPAMPDRGYGPGGVLNPYNLLWAVVVIGFLGLLGYIAMRAAGPRRGAMLLGFIGGFMSSTAVTLNAAQAVREHKDAAPLLAASIAAAQAVMFVRTAILVAILNVRVLQPVAVPAIAGAVTAAAVAALLFRRATSEAQGRELPFGNPDQLLMAFEFIAVVIIALLVGHYAEVYAGDFGMIASSLVAGGVDVDAATVSVSTIAGGEADAPSVDSAAIAIVTALSANSVVKVVIAYVRGSRALGLRAGVALIGSALAAIAALIAMQFVGA